MKLRRKDLLKIYENIYKNVPNIYNNGSYLKDITSNSVAIDDFFYTLEYMDILTNEVKNNHTYTMKIIENEKLKMLLYIMKNKNIKYDENYFKLVYDLYIKISSIIFNNGDYKMNESSNINLEYYNHLLLFLSFNYESFFLHNMEDFYLEPFINIFLEQLNIIIDSLIFDDVYDILKQLQGYNPLLINILSVNIDYLKVFSLEKANHHKEEYKKYHKLNVICDIKLEIRNFIINYAIEYFINYNKQYDYSVVTTILTNIDSIDMDYYNLEEEDIIQLIQNEFDRHKHVKKLN